MDILVIALSINPRPLSALELKLSGLIMESRVDTAGDNQNAHVIISNSLFKFISDIKMADSIADFHNNTVILLHGPLYVVIFAQIMLKANL